MVFSLELSCAMKKMDFSFWLPLSALMSIKLFSKLEMFSCYCPFPRRLPTLNSGQLLTYNKSSSKLFQIYFLPASEPKYGFLMDCYEFSIIFLMFVPHHSLCIYEESRVSTKQQGNASAEGEPCFPPQSVTHRDTHNTLSNDLHVVSQRSQKDTR